MGIEVIGAGMVGVSTAPLVRQETAGPAAASVASTEATQARGTTDQMALSDQARQRTAVTANAEASQAEDEAKAAARKAEEKTLFNKFFENLNMKVLERILDEMKATANS
ncbi:MAG: hypothetical protein VKP57_08320 [Candidatus Sericytochromatia bacterium]|nr:hypothetical protein [Candidatus Sericytochromatia bacterium]